MAKNEEARRFVVLVRHASREKRWDQPESEHQMKNWGITSPGKKADFEKEGRPLTYALAGRLCDELENWQVGGVEKILHSEHTVARQTAKIYAEVLKERNRFEVELCPSPKITPRNYDYNHIRQEIEVFEHSSADSADKRAYIIVGHQPHLTHIGQALLLDRRSYLAQTIGKFSISRKLLHNTLPGNLLPLGGSEAACLQLDNEPQLLWLLTVKPKNLLNDLKDKVKSKYDVAKFFLGAFVVNTGLILSALIWGQSSPLSDAHPVDLALAGFAIAMILVSLAFTAATLFSYDGLMMPPEFWSESSEGDGGPRWTVERPPRWSVGRPPSQATVVLLYEMMHVWQTFFIPAIASAFAAVGVLIVALAHAGLMARAANASHWLYNYWWTSLAALFVVVTLAFLLPATFYKSRMPRLGSED